MAHGYNELELTNKGRRALEDEDIEIPSILSPDLKVQFLMVLAMTRSGLDISDMTRDLVEASGGRMELQMADSLIESLVNYLESKGYVRWIPCEDEEPPEAFGEFKDYF